MSLPLPEARSVAVQSVLFENDPAVVWRLTRAVDAGARLAIRAGGVGRVTLAFGDSSAARAVTDQSVGELREECSSLADISYDAFGENLGSSGGQNRLARAARGDILLILNPDTCLAPNAIHELVRALERPRVGAADARQVPLEHPKAYDPREGDTSWVSGCCMMVWRALFLDLDGFDDEHFVLHCDDVDFSWRVRASGWRVVTAPRAVVFHDKRPTRNQTWPAPEHERYHAVLGRLMLATRWGRPDIVRETVAVVETARDAVQLRALTDFNVRRCEGTVPTPVAHSGIAEFVDGEYAVHRF
jgi:hypothetical protein